MIKATPVTLAFLVTLFASGFAFAGPAKSDFDGLTCQSNIAQELVGRKMSNEPVVKTEARYKSLDLKDLGADEISDNLSSIVWRICGNQYVLLMKKDRVQSALKIPEQFRNSGEVMTCMPLDKALTGYYLAVSGKRSAKSIHADAAWVLDEKQAKFVLVESAVLECEREPGS